MSNYDKRKLFELSDGEKDGLRILLWVLEIIFLSVFGLAGLIFLIVKG